MDEYVQIKKRIPSKKKQQRRKDSWRRMRWSRGLPSLATNTVRMVAATLQIGQIINEETIDTGIDDDEEIFPIGQQVEAHIPDIVLNHLHELIDSKGNFLIPNEHLYQQSTLLFLDVSGFTSLTEQYSNDAHLGVDQLTHTLNSYFDKLVSEILKHNGDIYKFAGDAILALWTNDTHGIEQAFKCAVHLQDKCGAYQTDVGVILHLKVALAYGSVRAVFIGTEEFKYYILIGDCVKDVNHCEQICEAGDIIITRKIYEYVRERFAQYCEFVSIGDEIDRHYSVKYLGMMEEEVEQNSEISIDGNQSSVFDEEFMEKIDSIIKSFLLRGVYQRIERQQSLDYLSELRRVTISFLNLEISEEHYNRKDFYQNVQKVFNHIYELTKMMGGVLTKVLLFDKGWSFLCVFGLPGYTQGDDTANGLKCAHMIHSTIQKQYQFINRCSIGVATGLTYCGVVGHAARCEYTVIGRKVNMAARLMCNYPNIISCDQETYYNSRLNSRYFQILPDRILKGMNNVGIIWQYAQNEMNVQSKEKSDDVQSENYPLLGRRVELMIIAAQVMLLDEPLSSSNPRRDLAAIIFQGDDKIGRSRLLQFLVQAFTSHEDNRSSIRVINDRCQLEQRFNQFALLQSLLRQLFGFNQLENTQYDREQYLLRLFDVNKSNDLHFRRNLFLLNDLLDVRFRRSQLDIDHHNDVNFVRNYEMNINELLLHILNQLIDSNVSKSRISSTSSSIVLTSKILFIIDDIHFADESSLKHLLTLGSHHRCLLILSMKPPTNNNNDRAASNILQSISTDSRVYLRRLPGLELRHIATLGCQLLSVHKLPSKLVKILNENCNGIPGFCEEILFDLLQKDKIHITDDLNLSDHDSNLIEGDPDKLLRNTPMNRSLFQTLFSRRKYHPTFEQRQSESAFSRLCLLRDPHSTDFAADCQENFQNYIMYRIDRLSEGESLLVKIAAVIGNTFSRTFLWQLVDPQSKKLINMNSGILALMQRSVLECAYRQQQMSKSRTIKCFCRQNPGGFPSQCRLMVFTHVSIREGIYNSLTDTLKRILIRNAIDYLEKQSTIICLTCGPRNDLPYFVQKHDDLTRMIKTSHQHAFVDIVKMAALKEIDNTIQHLIKIRSLNIRMKHRSNTSTNVPTTAPVRSVHRIESKRRNSFGTIDIPSRRSQSPFQFEQINHRSIVDSGDAIPVEKDVPRRSKKFFQLPRRRTAKEKTIEQKRFNRFRAWFRCFFCRFQSIPSDHQHDLKFNLIPPDSTHSMKSSSSSHWSKVRQAVLPTRHKPLQPCPSDDQLLERSIFSRELMTNIHDDLQQLNEQIYPIRTFQNLYDQSFIFHNFQSFVQYKNLIQYAHERRNHPSPSPPDLNEYLTYNDLRICQCADYILTVYMKLVEYHSQLYDMYEKLTDDRRDYLLRKEFDRMIYYRIEICRLLLRLNSFQRLLVEIENGRQILNEYIDQSISSFQYLLTKYTYNLFETIVLQRTRAISDAKNLCEESLKVLTELRQGNQQEISAKDKRIQYHQLSNSSQTSDTDHWYDISINYRLDYLICQYHLVQYQLSRQQSIESLHILLQLDYHIYPIIFSVPCTIILIEYFFIQMNYSQCLFLINQMIDFWWIHLTNREKLELGKLKSLSLIIELKQSSLESSILSGYFAKRLLTGYHENIFLIETCIHLTLALIGEMRISNIELILQHLEYLSEQTMNCYAKLWYYILVIDVAIELGYELLPITLDFLENISKYRKKLLAGSNQRSLLMIYSDCILAQVYIRLGFVNHSKIHFHQALYQIKYDQMYLSHDDFRLTRGLLKLIECQLLHWYSNREDLTKENFLLSTIEEHIYQPWNRTRFYIYQAYYDRLINAYRREEDLPIDNLYNWEMCLMEGETNAIKLDREWIRYLRQAWLKPVDEQIAFQINHCRTRPSTVMMKSVNRYLIRPSIPYLMKMSSKIEKNGMEESHRTMENYSQQIFVDWRLFLTNNNLPQFQLYLLPVDKSMDHFRFVF